jgi:hypothetical protein
MDLKFNPDDGLDAVFFRLLVKFHQREKVTEVGYSQGRHFTGTGCLHQRLYPEQTIDKGILGVYMQVYKSFLHIQSVKLLSHPLR